MVIARSVEVVKLEHERFAQPVRESALRAAVGEQASANEAPFEPGDVAVRAALDQDFGELVPRDALSLGSARPTLTAEMRGVQAIVLNQTVDTSIVCARDTEAELRQHARDRAAAGDRRHEPIANPRLPA
jgi:hypothetical protein